MKVGQVVELGIGKIGLSQLTIVEITRKEVVLKYDTGVKIRLTKEDYRSLIKKSA